MTSAFIPHLSVNDTHIFFFNKGGKSFLLKKKPKKGLAPGDEGLSLETSAFESIYGDQFTLSSHLKKKKKKKKNFTSSDDSSLIFALLVTYSV